MKPKEAHRALMEIAAGLCRGGMSGLSPYADDMPKTTPKSVLDMIAAEGDRQIKLAVRIRDAADALFYVKTDAIREHCT